ncbi:MAG: sulfotransferase family 2 domain-containing protein [Candidatus Promineifilaceae bacterium]|nr:sulfotransferase family 2 domain-containing protein [Candidatus Promineifilaceae bacterium]
MNDDNSSGDPGHDRRPAIFLHIPKTAGTTLHRIIESQYKPEELFTFGSDAHAAVEDFKRRDLQERSKIRLLRGHMAFGLHAYLPSTNQYFTILREPFARIVSYYNFILRTPDHYLYEIVDANNMSLSDLLQSRLPLMMNDGQVRLLSGVWGNAPFGEVSDDMLETAIRNLDEYFIVVGLTEKFDQTLCLLQTALGWSSDILYKRHNVSRKGLTKDQLPEAATALVRKYNQQDIQLYAHAKRIFAQRIKQQGALFPLKVKLFQVRNHWEPIFWKLRSYSIRAHFRKKLLS